MTDELGVVPFHANLRSEFREGPLWRRWANRYPELFDELDITAAANSAHLGYHFYEWLSAIVLFNSLGYHSLVESYQFRKHTRKQTVLAGLLPRSVSDLVCGRQLGAGPQCPDLLVYAPDHSDWFFCEVKGPRDRLTEKQRQFFGMLADAGGRPVYTLKLQELRAPVIRQT